MNNGLNGILLVLLGVFFLYLAVTGKLNCIISAFTACKRKESGDGNGVQAIASGEVSPELTGKSSTDILKNFNF